MDKDGQLPMKTSQSGLSLQPKTSTENSKAEAVAASLARLALHYWRPDFAPQQARLLLADFLSDLAPYSPEEISAACDAYRRSGEKFFPTPGNLLQHIRQERGPRPRLQTFRAADRNLLAGPQATKTVAEVLRENGFADAARKWDSNPQEHSVKM